MGEHTAISWTHHTFNIWWGCQHAPAEPGAAAGDTDPCCANCYAETFDKRIGGEHWGPGPRRFFGDAYWAKPLAWNAAAESAGIRARVFCSSMADWAELHPDPEVNARMDAARERMWRLIRATPWLDWLLLTKRAERLPELLPWHNLKAYPQGPNCHDCADKAASDGICESDGMPCDPREPWPNVWPGVTCGTRRSLWRIAELRKVSAAVRFVSCEPLLEHITETDWDTALDWTGNQGPDTWINWLIVGDESGHRRRPAQPDWIRTARDAALRHGVAFHLKQLHIVGPEVQGKRSKNGLVHLPIFDGKVHDDCPEVHHG